MTKSNAKRSRRKRVHKLKNSSLHKRSREKTNRKNKTYKKHDFNSGEGMLTSVWGPTLWHYLHTMSFNYPINPTMQQKKQYSDFVKSLVHVLPCKYCRINLVKNFKTMPLLQKHMKTRETFSRYIYKLHEHVNKMLGKQSGLSYNDVRERYEHFRARCTLTEDEVKKLIMMRKRANKANKTRKKERGCTTPLYGKKSKCIIKIVPHDTKCNSFQIDERCIKKNMFEN